MTGETVLIIEDDTSLLRGLKDNFEDGGYSTQTTTNGTEGFTMALADPPDLILLDIMLPGMSGYDICYRIREADLDMPIIMITAKGQEQDIIRGLNLGADDYVTKPFSIKEVMARAKALLRRNQAKDGEIFRFGECELNTGSARFFRQGKEIILTPKEYKLLCHFLRKAGRALTRDEIMDAVWGRDILVTARSVDRCIATLRAKVEPEHRHPHFIQTIRDIGYRFEGEEPA